MTYTHSKIRLLLSLCCLVAASLAVIAQTPNAKMTPTMTKADRTQLLKRFDDATKQTLDAVTKLTDAQWNYKAAPEKWSVGETLEHITITEGFLLKTVQDALAAPANPMWAERTRGKIEILERRMLNREIKAQAPEPIVPTGKLTRAEVMARFKSHRAATRKLMAVTQAEVHAHTQDHPEPTFGTLSAYQWLIFTALHNLRHNLQIEEVKTGAGFPKA
ncbi:MAG: DinB family protein [Acidobacteria bacterium]|nr:DinB family protein [Acidobacteriota bacterium]